MADYDLVKKFLDQGIDGLQEGQDQSMMSKGPAASTDSIVDRAPASEPVEPTVEEVNQEAKSPYMKEKTYEEKLLEQLQGIRNQSKEDVAAARKDDRQRALYANLAKALGSIGAAEVQRKAGVKAGLQPFTPAKVESTAKDVMADKRADIQALLDEYKIRKAGKPSKKIYQTRSGLVEIGEDGQPKPIYEDPYMKSTADIRKESLGLRSDKFTEKKKQKLQDDAEKAIKSMRGTDAWKDSEKALSSIREVDLLLEDAHVKGGQSLSMLGPRIAKGIAGEVGVLTEQDVTRYVKNPQLVQGILDTKAKLMEGKLTDESYENLKRLLEVSKRAAEDKRRSAVDREARLFARREGVPFEDALYMIDEAYNVVPAEQRKSEKKDSEYDAQTEARIQKVMAANPSASRDQIIKALKAKGKL